jgi:glycosyltransferase involved in cell wall biosynthesis
MENRYMPGKIMQIIHKVKNILQHESFSSLMARIGLKIKDKLRLFFRLKTAKVPEITAEMNLTIGVVIPCKNHAGFLAEAVDSVYANKTNITIHTVIINDGSTDGTELTAAALIKKYPNVQYIYHPQSLGLPASRNDGISRLNTDYILCLDADDKIPDNYIQSCCELLAVCDVAYTNAQCFGVSDNLCNYPEFSPAIFSHGNFVNCSAIYRRAMWEKLKGYDETMKLGWEDYEFWIRAYKNGYTFKKNHDTFIFWRKHQVSLTTTMNANLDKLQKYLKDKYPDFYIGNK